MGFERQLLLDQETQASDAATRRIPLPAEGGLSGLELRTRITNGSTAGEESIMEALDTIEVVADGSNVLFALEAAELARLNWFVDGRFPPSCRNEAADGVQELTLPILFGRFLGDPEFYLDLAQYRRVELRIEYSPTIAVTSFAAGTTEFHIPMWISPPDAMPGPRRGWLRTTQVYNFLSVLAGQERIELARLHPYYDIMVYAREAGIDDGVDITVAEIQINDRRFTPFIGRWDDIQNENERMFGIDPSVIVHANRADDAAISMFTGRIRDARVEVVQDLAAAADFTLVNVASVAGDQITLHAFQVEGSSTYADTILQVTRQELYVTAKGVGVGNAILIPFALRGNPDLALPAPDFSKVELVLTNGAAGADVRVATREIVAG